MIGSLSTFLFREVRPEFFRVLSGPLGRLYVDVLDALEQEASRRNHGMERDEAVGLVEQVIEHHLDSIDPGDESMANAATLRDKARAVVETLKNAGWLSEDESRSDYQKFIFFEANGILLLQSLRRIAFPDAAVFSDKLVTVCTTLVNTSALAEEPWAQVETCIANLQSGLAELRSMEYSIKRFTRQQLATTTLKENLFVLFDQFAERIGRTCYAQMVHARLPSRIAEARRVIDNDLSHADLQAKMQTEVLRREPSLTPEAAMARVRLHVDELSQLLEQIEPLANDIDRRTADFARRSQARFRYLQETTSEKRACVQTFFETLNRHFAGHRLAAIDELDLEFPGLLLHDTRVIGGIESLYIPPLRREAGEIEPIEDPNTDQQDRTLAQLEGTMRDSLTVSRANRFIANLPGEKGAHIDSEDLLRNHVHNDEDIADLIACLLHARSADAKFDLRVPRRDADADKSEFDEKLTYRVERFTIVKK